MLLNKINRIIAQKIGMKASTPFELLFVHKLTVPTAGKTCDNNRAFITAEEFPRLEYAAKEELARDRVRKARQAVFRRLDDTGDSNSKFFCKIALCLTLLMRNIDV